MNPLINDIIMNRYSMVMRNRTSSMQDIMDTQKLLSRQLEELVTLDKTLDTIREEMMPKVPAPGFYRNA